MPRQIRPIFQQLPADFIPGITSTEGLIPNPKGGRSRRGTPADPASFGNTMLSIANVGSLEEFAEADPNPVRAAERRKLIANLRSLQRNQNIMNAARASSLLSAPGRNLLSETIQRGLISQPLLYGGA